MVTWIGAGLTLLYFGAEDFSLNAIGQRAVNEQNLKLLVELTEAVRYNPAAITVFGAGLVLLAVGSILAAVAVLAVRPPAPLERSPARSRLRPLHPAVLRHPGDEDRPRPADHSGEPLAGVIPVARTTPMTTADPRGAFHGAGKGGPESLPGPALTSEISTAPTTPPAASASLLTCAYA